MNEHLLGKRVEIPVHLDAWMQGDRYGEVVRVDRENMYVRMDRSGRTLTVELATFDKFGGVVVP